MSRYDDRYDLELTRQPAAPVERDAMAWPPAAWEPEWADDAPRPAQNGPSSAGFGLFAREVVQTLVLAVLRSLGLQAVVQQRLVEGSSMEPTLHTGQRLLINRLAVQGFGEPQRGDIVVFHSWTDDKDYIKRVIGVPGDRVDIHDSKVYVNGVVLDEPYLNQPTTDHIGPVELKPDEFYVMGDNRGNSADSRYYGPLHRDRIVGTAFLSLWPIQDFGPLIGPTAVHAGR
jgi:signal peptidase I